jgi:hypothetical protein
MPFLGQLEDFICAVGPVRDVLPTSRTITDIIVWIFVYTCVLRNWRLFISDAVDETSVTLIHYSGLGTNVERRIS